MKHIQHLHRNTSFKTSQSFKQDVFNQLKDPLTFTNSISNFYTCGQIWLFLKLSPFWTLQQWNLLQLNTSILSWAFKDLQMPVFFVNTVSHSTMCYFALHVQLLMWTVDLTINHCSCFLLFVLVFKYLNNVQVILNKSFVTVLVSQISRTLLKSL